MIELLIKLLLIWTIFYIVCKIFKLVLGENFDKSLQETGLSLSFAQVWWYTETHQPLLKKKISSSDPSVVIGKGQVYQRTSNSNSNSHFFFRKPESHSLDANFTFNSNENDPSSNQEQTNKSNEYEYYEEEFYEENDNDKVNTFGVRVGRKVLRFGNENRNFLKKYWFTFGIFVSMICLLFSIALFIYNLYSIIVSLYSIFISQPIDIQLSESMVLKPLIPGVTIPLSELFFFLISLFICGVFHEFGHALAAISEGAGMDGFGCFIVFLYPGAFVSLSQTINLLSPIQRLKIYSAGSYHNFILTIFSLLLLLSLPLFLFPFYGSPSVSSISHLPGQSPQNGVIVTNVDWSSSLSSKFEVGDTIISQIDDCLVSDSKQWNKCYTRLLQKIQKRNTFNSLYSQYYNQHSPSSSNSHPSSLNDDRKKQGHYHPKDSSNESDKKSNNPSHLESLLENQIKEKERKKEREMHQKIEKKIQKELQNQPFDSEREREIEYQRLYYLYKNQYEKEQSQLPSQLSSSASSSSSVSSSSSSSSTPSLQRRSLMSESVGEDQEDSKYLFPSSHHLSPTSVSEFKPKGYCYISDQLQKKLGFSSEKKEKTKERNNRNKEEKEFNDESIISSEECCTDIENYQGSLQCFSVHYQYPAYKNVCLSARQVFESQPAHCFSPKDCPQGIRKRFSFSSSSFSSLLQTIQLNFLLFIFDGVCFCCYLACLHPISESNRLLLKIEIKSLADVKSQRENFEKKSINNNIIIKKNNTFVLISAHPDYVWSSVQVGDYVPEGFIGTYILGFHFPYIIIKILSYILALSPALGIINMAPVFQMDGYWALLATFHYYVLWRKSSNGNHLSNNINNYNTIEDPLERRRRQLSSISPDSESLPQFYRIICTLIFYFSSFLLGSNIILSLVMLNL